MSRGPPFRKDDSTTWPDWRSETTRLDYPGRDIRIIFPAEQGGTVHNPKYAPAEFGDFDPSPDDPDPDVWPVEEVDPGYPAETDELIRMQNPFPAPHVAWVTEEYFEERYGYPAHRQEVDVENLPFSQRPDNWHEGDTVEILATNDSSNSMELTDDRLEALGRIARLWNGDTVRGHHLLLDKCPSWENVLGDLDQSELERIVVDPKSNPALAEAFGDYGWYEVQQSVYTKPKSIVRKKVWYAPTQKGRTLINKTSQLPDLIGDPSEGLAHRFTVGLTMAREVANDRKFETYRELDPHVIDILSQDKNENLFAGEIMTGHHKWTLHRETYKKLRYLFKRGVTPYVVFDSRETAYEIFNHWQRKNLCELPGGTFDSDFNIDNGREKVHNAYQDDQFDWIVSDWTTTSKLWENTLGSDDPGISTETITSVSW